MEWGNFLKVIEDFISLDILEKEFGRGKVWVVGGSVRDFLLGKDEIEDLDLVCEKNAIQKGFSLAKKLNAVPVVLDKDFDEIRIVFKEKQKWIDLTSLKASNIHEDLRQRDFTINSIAFDPFKKELIDPFKGIKDIESKIIMTVRESNLIEDPVRIIRAFRFASNLNFTIESKTLEWIRKNIEEIKKSSPERIQLELFKMFSNFNNEEYVMEKMEETGLLFILIPELEKLKGMAQVFYQYQKDLLGHSIETMINLNKILKTNEFPEIIELSKEVTSEKKHIFLLGALLHDIGKPYTVFYDDEGNTHFHGHDRIGANIVLKFARRLKFSKKDQHLLHLIVKYHMYPHLLSREGEITQRALGRYLRKTEILAFPLILLAIADARASTTPLLGIGKLKSFAKKLINFKKEIEKKKPKRLLTGFDLIDLGLKPGPIFKQILQEIEELQYAGEITTKDKAIEYVKKKWLNPS